MRRGQSHRATIAASLNVCGPPARARSTQALRRLYGPRQDLGLWPLLISHCLLCPQTDTSDPEKVVSAFLKVSSVFKDEATVRTAVQDAVGNVGSGTWVAPASSLLQGGERIQLLGSASSCDV